MPLVRPAQARTGGNRDTFVVELDPPYTAFTYATYLGGSNNDEGSGVAVDRVGRVFTAGAASYPSPGALGASDAFVYGISSGLAGVDTDSDGLADDWETQFGTDPDTNDAAADPDGDGFTNAQEHANGTHPTGYFTRYLAEGSTGAFFDDRIALFNPGADLATVVLRFQRDTGAEIQQVLAIPARSRATVNPETIVGLENAAFATVIESNQSVVVDRTMTWDGTGFGSHAETSIEQPATTWYLAEGSTAGNFDLYYLLQNPNASAADGHHHLPAAERRPGHEVLHGQPAQPSHHQHRQRDRLRRTAGHRAHAAEHRRLGDDHLDQRRADPGRARDVHDGQRPRRSPPATTAPASPRRRPAGSSPKARPARSSTCSSCWPTRATTPTTVEITYLLSGGTQVVRQYGLPAQSRRTVYVDSRAWPRQRRDVGGRALARTPPCRSSSSARCGGRTATGPRPTTAPARSSRRRRWALADGEVGGTFANQTYVLIANTSAFTATVRVTGLLRGSGLAAVGTYNVPANSRFNVDYSNTIAQGRRFSVLVEGIGPTPGQEPQLVVERAMYSNSGNTVWAAGTDALGTPIFPPTTFTVTPNGLFPKVLVVDDGEPRHHRQPRSGPGRHHRLRTGRPRHLRRPAPDPWRQPGVRQRPSDARTSRGSPRTS